MCLEIEEKSKFESKLNDKHQIISKLTENLESESAKIKSLKRIISEIEGQLENKELKNLKQKIVHDQEKTQFERFEKLAVFAENLKMDENDSFISNLMSNFR